MRNKFIYCVVSLILSSCVLSCSRDAAFHQDREAAYEAARKRRITKSFQNIDYVRDERTGICYAYKWGGMAHGGPAMAVVPLEKCKHLLLNPPKDD